MVGTTCIFQKKVSVILAHRDGVGVVAGGAEMMAPTGIDGAEGEANAPTEVESCNAEEVIASDRRGGGTRGARAAAAEARGAGGNPRLDRRL